MKSLKILLLVLTFAFTNIVVAQSVYTTKTGEKYHKSSCKYLKYSKKEYTLKKALELGFRHIQFVSQVKANRLQIHYQIINKLVQSKVHLLYNVLEKRKQENVVNVKLRILTKDAISTK